MSYPVGYIGISDLAVGEEVEIKSGRGPFRLEATATVSRNLGGNSIYVRLVTISVKGENVSVLEGDEILAGANEIYW